ncbi:hypothetical protein L9F63_020833, partial [Diploptera punctata]
PSTKETFVILIKDDLTLLRESQIIEGGAVIPLPGTELNDSDPGVQHPAPFCHA